MPPPKHLLATAHIRRLFTDCSPGMGVGTRPYPRSDARLLRYWPTWHTVRVGYWFTRDGVEV